MPFVSVIAASVSAFPSLSRVVDHDNDQNQKSDTVQAKQNIEQCGEKEIFLVSSGVGISVLSVSSDESEETEELSETVHGRKPRLFR